MVCKCAFLIPSGLAIRLDQVGRGIITKVKNNRVSSNKDGAFSFSGNV